MTMSSYSDCKITLIDYPSTENNNHSIYEFKIQKNSGGGDCLFKAISQCRSENSEEGHNIERKQIINYAVKTKNWPILKEFILGQHVDEIPIFKKREADNNLLKNAYLCYMSALGAYGTIAELQIASKIQKQSFNFSLLTYNDSTREATVQNFVTQNSTDWFYFLFTGPINAGHWERLESTYFPSEKLGQLPLGLYYLNGWSNTGPSIMYLSNNLKEKCNISPEGHLGKVKRFISALPFYNASPVEKIPSFSIMESPNIVIDKCQDLSNNSVLSKPIVHFSLKCTEKVLESNVEPRGRKRTSSSRNPEHCKRHRKSRSRSKSSSPSRKTSHSRLSNNPVKHKSILKLANPPTSLRYSFQGSRVLIVGGAENIGKDISKKFISDGAHVVILDRDEKCLEALRSELSSLVTGNVDFSDFQSIKMRLNSEEPFNHLVIINQLKSGNFFNLDISKHNFHDNLKISLNFIKYFTTEMILKGSPSKTERTIVNVLYTTEKPTPLYNCESETMKSFTKNMALEIAEFTIRVNSIQVIRHKNTQLNSIKEEVSLPGEDFTELTNTVLYLSSPLSEGINGGNIEVVKKKE